MTPHLNSTSAVYTILPEARVSLAATRTPNYLIPRQHIIFLLGLFFSADFLTPLTPTFLKSLTLLISGPFQVISISLPSCSNDELGMCHTVWASALVVTYLITHHCYSTGHSAHQKQTTSPCKNHQETLPGTCGYHPWAGTLPYTLPWPSGRLSRAHIGCPQCNTSAPFFLWKVLDLCQHS